MKIIKVTEDGSIACCNCNRKATRKTSLGNPKVIKMWCQECWIEHHKISMNALNSFFGYR